MKFLSFSILVLLLTLSGGLMAQEAMGDGDRPAKAPIRVPTTLLDGERVPWILLPEVNVYGRRTFASEEERKNYYRLRYNVLKVLPYAKLAEEKYAQLHRDLALVSKKRDQRRLVKACEKDIKHIFNKEVKNLTITQGEILLKLIDRQTGNSSFEVVKELRGGVSAFLYQSIAKVFGHDLKNEYSLQEDRDIENIIRAHERLSRYY